MVCDKCSQQALWYYKVFENQGNKFWCPSCVDGVPTGQPRYRWVNYGFCSDHGFGSCPCFTAGHGKFERVDAAPTIEEHLQDKLDEAWRKVADLEEDLRLTHRHNKGLGTNNQKRMAEIADLEGRLKTSIEAQARQIKKIGRMGRDFKTQAQAIENHVKENERLLARVHDLEDKIYWGKGSMASHAFAQQQAQYNAMLQQQVKAAQMSASPPFIFKGGMSGLGCIAPGTAMVTKESFEKEQKTLNKKIRILREAVETQRSCEINKHCPACLLVTKQALENTDG